MAEDDYDIPDQPEIPDNPAEQDVPGWLDVADQALADAKTYADEQDEQVLTVAGRLVPRNMDRPPEQADGADLPAGTGWNEYDASGDLVQMWRWDGAAWQTLDMSPTMIPVLDVGSQTVGDLTADRIQGGHFTGETFEGGSFVGGEFRTSDTLPGQVTLSDTAAQGRPGLSIEPDDSTGYDILPSIGPADGWFEIDGGRSTSGERTSITMSPSYSLIRADGSSAGAGTSDISVQPAEAEVVARKGVHRGSIKARPGRVILGATHPNGADAALAAADTLSARINAYRTDGSRAGSVEATTTTATVSVRDAAGTTRGSMEVSETGATSRSFSGNASESGWVRARPQDAELAYVDANNTYFSRIKADASEAFLYTRAGGTSRYLSVDATGVWVKTGAKSYNLEETAQDSGWQSFSPVAGMDSYALAWRNKGGVIYMRGTVTATWQAGWNTVATNLPVEMRPAIRVVRLAPSTSEQGLYFRMGNDGVLEFNKPTAGTRTGDLSAIFYPAD